VAEESGKGIALVILGIVAIIAIVGLVLLFTGARKATGEFAVPGAKEYGGAVRGIADPYARAFSGRSYEYPSGMDEIARAQGQMDTLAGGVKVASDQVTGESPYVKGIYSQYSTAYNRQREEIPSVLACEWLSIATFGDNRYGTPVEASAEFAAMGGSSRCLVMSDLMAYDWTVLANQYGLDRDNVVKLKENAAAIADGAYACCLNPGLKNY